ncbi:MAG: hypothetical protein II697_07270 [Clostridia bacterium]|nr:hypothetical protein [Clostridia bacterium]
MKRAVWFWRRAALGLMALLLLLPALSGRAEVAASGSHALYLDAQGQVWAWGSNHRGESLPGEKAEAVCLPQRAFSGAAQIACARQFSLALDKEGAVWIWGGVPAGMLDNAEPFRTDAPVRLAGDAIKIAADESCCALLFSNGQARWFDGAWHEIEGPVRDVAVGMAFALYVTEKDEARITGEGYLQALYGESLDRTLLEGCKGVYAAGQTALLIGKDGALYAMGASGSEGRLGLDTPAWLTQPVPNGVANAVCAFPGLSCSGALDAGGQLYLWGGLYSWYTSFDSEGAPQSSTAEGMLLNFGKTPAPVYANVKSAAVGDAFAIVEFMDGRLVSFGSNDWGQAGDGARTLFQLIPDEDDDGDESDSELIVTDNQQRVFPSEVLIGKEQG